MIITNKYLLSGNKFNVKFNFVLKNDEKLNKLFNISKY